MAKGGLPTGGAPKDYICSKCGRLYSANLGTCSTEGCGGSIVKRTDLDTGPA